MRIIYTCSLALLCAAPLVAQTKEPKPKAEPITLTGCIERTSTSPTQYTIAEEDGSAYRLTGKDIREYFGRRVQIVGAVPSSGRLVIKGGLTPNPNVAAQGGGTDPARAAVASQGGSAGPGNVELPEFKVKSVRPVSGECAR